MTGPHRSSPPSPPDLSASISAVHAEVAAHDEAARRVAARQAASRSRRSPLLPALVLTVIVGVVLGTVTFRRAPAPAATDLERGIGVMLRLAAQAVLDHVERTGQVPGSLQELLPAAADVRLTRVAEGILLVATDPAGREQRLLLPLIERRLP